MPDLIPSPSGHPNANAAAAEGTSTPRLDRIVSGQHLQGFLAKETPLRARPDRRDGGGEGGDGAESGAGAEADGPHRRRRRHHGMLGMPCDWKISRSHVRIAIESVGPGWARFTETKPAAARLIESLQRGSAPPYAHLLPGHLPAPPEDLHRYLRTVLKNGAEIADAGLYEDSIVEAPRHLRKFMSGGTMICHLIDWRNAAFFGSIFHHIQMNSPCDVQITTWDLFHGHMFVHINRDKDELDCDLGILFHAKEFPKELRRNRLGKVIPIGSEEAGGRNDVRIGTQCSIEQPLYYMRNYIWLLSTNEVVLLDTHFKELEPIVQNKEFHTINSFSFKQVADINYFPPNGQGLDVHKLIAEEERKDLKALLLRSVTDKEAPHEDRAKGVQAVLENMRQSKRHRWFASQVSHFIATSRETAKHVYATPRASLASPTLLIKESLKSVTKAIARLDGMELKKLQGLLGQEKGKSDHPLLSGRICDHARSFILQEILHEESRRTLKRKEAAARCLQQLLDKNILREDAKTALELTKSDSTGILSAFRAENLLQASYTRYRPEELVKKYGSENFDIKFAAEYQRHAFYAESTLRAIALDKKEKLGPAEAGARISRIVARETHETWERQRKRRSYVVTFLEGLGMTEKIIRHIYEYEVSS